jgi:His-Xaa-Ser system radical SAM maturase HxsC
LARDRAIRPLVDGAIDMIALRIAAEAPEAVGPFVVRVGDSPAGIAEGPTARLVATEADRVEFLTPAGPLHLSGMDPTEYAGDILLVFPRQKTAHRIIRAGAMHNTFLITEQCDQACVMCSQPPKKHHQDLFSLFETAARLAPKGISIGISGGEPTLHKRDLLTFLRRTLARRPDLSFHVLTNGQHFSKDDLRELAQPCFTRVVWGIPLYSDHAPQHDEIVKKEGAFTRLLESFNVLAQVGAQVELRTVVLNQNLARLPSLANYIATMVPFASRWAIMQLERIGYARMNWDKIFFDHSVEFAPIGSALDIARARGIDARLYNFPLCTVPGPYRTLADCSISDWKRRYLDACNGCTAQGGCSGFFQWYSEENGFTKILPQ